MKSDSRRHRFVRPTLFALLLAWLLPTAALTAADPPPLIDPQAAIQQFRCPAGFKMDLWAAEPQLLNPVAFSIDEQGRVYIAETYRYRKSVYDIRSHMDMYADDLACRTVADREAMIHQHLGAKWGVLTNESERVRVLEDRAGTGRADYSTILADGFNSVLDGLGAGVLARQGKVYFANIPNLWLLEDTNHVGPAAAKISLSFGYGVHFSLTGHDLHAPRFGPDGRLYFSIGDRGLNVTNREGRVLDYPDTGAILRCEPDGANLEVFATGVRNPQGLAFDNYGNLFTGDNNCDYGDSARLVYLIEGGDSGWRIGNQISETTPAGLWNSEKMWHLQFPGQAAYIVPPIAHLAQGPAGFNHYPGTGFPAVWRDHFFLCDYKGASLNAGVHAFAVRPKGAGFEMVGRTNFLWDILATDIEFSPDGRLFVADWVAHWPRTDKGRLYRLYDPALVNSPEVLSTKQLLGEGMEQRPVPELTGLLGHPDQRVRQAAQFALADRGAAAAVSAFQTTARSATNQLARVHALWGLGQVGRRGPGAGVAAQAAAAGLQDPDAEVRAQAAKVLGEILAPIAVPALIDALHDGNTRVRGFAAISLGKLNAPAAVPALLAVARENADRDPYLRHAVVMGLVGCADAATLAGSAGADAPAVRMAVLLAMRRLGLPEIARFLSDADPLIVLEAARAINDAPIPGAWPALAALAEHPGRQEMLDWRAVNANFRLGAVGNAARLARYAANPSAPEKVRAEALHALETWARPAPRERLTGLYRPLPARPAAPALAAAAPALDTLLRTGPTAVRIAAIHASLGLAQTNTLPLLTEIAGNRQLPGKLRAEALTALGQFRDQRLPEILHPALTDPDPEVRSETYRLLAERNPEQAVAALTGALENGGRLEKQGAFATLGGTKGAAADRLLNTWLDRLAAGKVPAELQFDLLEAARQNTTAPIKKKVQTYEAKRPANDEFAGYRELLAGGDAAAGKKIFLERPQAGCITCHKYHGQGGAVGPEIAGIGGRQTREYLLESILFPNKKIAPGFENLILKTRAGETHAGVVQSETDRELVLNEVEDGLVRTVHLKKADIASRTTGPSAMPEGLAANLTKRELRDLVEFLATEK